MSRHEPVFEVRLARDGADLRAAQALRYDVFVRELGARGDQVDHEAGLEQDRFDGFCDHLLLFDHGRPERPVVGAYRVMREDQAARAGQFYSEDEYDLAPLRRNGRRLMELGRSCLHRDYRGGAAMVHLWQALGAYVARHHIEVLFGVASFHGTDPDALAHPLSLLHARHLAPAPLRVVAKPAQYQPMDLLPPDQIDRKRAMRETPALIKAYLRLGGTVGQGGWIDHAFNTIDVCLIMDTARLNSRAAGLYASREGRT